MPACARFLRADVKKACQARAWWVPPSRHVTARRYLLKGQVLGRQLFVDFCGSWHVQEGHRACCAAAKPQLSLGTGHAALCHPTHMHRSQICVCLGLPQFAHGPYGGHSGSNSQFSAAADPVQISFLYYPLGVLWPWGFDPVLILSDLGPLSVEEVIFT